MRSTRLGLGLLGLGMLGLGVLGLKGLSSLVGVESFGMLRFAQDDGNRAFFRAA